MSILSHILFSVLLLLAFTQDAFAEVRAAIAPPSITDRANFARPEEFPNKDQFYRDYIASRDQNIFQQYVDRWSFVETRGSYEIEAQGQARAYQDPLLGQSDVEARRAFADSIVRQRLDGAIRQYLTDRERGKEMRNANKVVEALRSYSVKIEAPSPAQKPKEIRVGYDVISDFSKLEYVSEDFELGYYHPGFSGSLSGRPTTPMIRLSLPSHGELPTASVAYYFDAGRTVDASLSKQLNKSVRAELATRQSLSAAALPNYSLRFNIDF